MTTRRIWPDARDGSKPLREKNSHCEIPIGRHEMERIPSPHGLDCNWLVLKGTKIGGAEGFWRQWQNYDDDFEIVIEET